MVHVCIFTKTSSSAIDNNLTYNIFSFYKKLKKNYNHGSGRRQRNPSPVLQLRLRQDLQPRHHHRHLLLLPPGPPRLPQRFEGVVVLQEAHHRLHRVHEHTGVHKGEVQQREAGAAGEGDQGGGEGAGGDQQAD